LRNCTMASGKRTYGVVIKFPVPGMVKTRLAKDIGEAAATEICKQLAEGVLRRTRSETREYERIIFYSPPHMRDRFEEWIPGEQYRPQRGGDVGEVMSNAFSEMFEDGSAKAVLTGTDIPGLHRGIIGRAFFELDRCEVVIGPAEDGGYYLIGMKLPRPELFAGISWGTAKVLRETLSRIKELKLTLSILAPLSDVDSVEDLPALKNDRVKINHCL
jgi:rSAM/selenodomain-associated transferase 1